MKKILILIIFCSLLLGCTKREDKLIMVTEAGFAPYEYYSDGKIVGVDVDIATEIANYLGKKLVVKDVAFDSIITEVKSGKSDIGAAGISYTEERSKQVDFSVDYTLSKQVVIVKYASRISSLDDLHDKRIAVQLGSIADTYVSDEYSDNSIIRHKKYLSAIEDLKDNKTDCVVMDELPAKAILNENNGLKILEEPLAVDTYGIIVDKGNVSLIKSDYVPCRLSINDIKLLKDAKVIMK